LFFHKLPLKLGAIEKKKANKHVCHTSKLLQLASTLLQLASKRDKLASKRDKLASKRDKLASKRDKLASKHDKLASKHDKLASKRDKLASKLLQGSLKNKIPPAEAGGNSINLISFFSKLIDT